MECLSESLGHGDVGQVKIIRGGHAIAVCVADVPACRSRDLPSRSCMDFSADLIDVWDGIKDEGMYEQQSLAARWNSQ